MLIWTAIILGIVEGLTEFLPISSTGHIILVEAAMGQEPAGKDLFEVFIQLGAILAIAWLYRGKLIDVALGALQKRKSDWDFIFCLVIGCLPAAVVGFLADDWITEHLFRPSTVAGALIVGGLLILLIERMRFEPVSVSVNQINFGQALIVGIAQVFSLFPGTSRSAATIMGGMISRMDRSTAAEFSFFLSLPIMAGASALKLAKHRESLHDLNLLISLTVGFIVSFIVAVVVVKWLMKFIRTNSFVPFAWYRIALGFIVLGAVRLGWM